MLKISAEKIELKTMKQIKLVFMFIVYFLYSWSPIFIQYSHYIRGKKVNNTENMQLKLKTSHIKQKGLGEACSNRKIWGNQKKKDFSSILKNVKMPFWNDSIYFEWNNSRKRVNCDKMMWDRIRPLKELVEAECIEYKGRFLKTIETYLYEISRQRSWAFPAHDKFFEYYNGRYFIELHSGKNIFNSKICHHN